MTSDLLLADLRRDEGLRLRAYPDPLSGGEPWTIGYGHTGSDVHPSTVWTPEEAETSLEQDAAHACDLLDRYAHWWRFLDPVRQDAMANLCFNMGWLSRDGKHGLGTFHHTLAAIQLHQWQEAHDGLLASAWAKEVGQRAQRIAHMILTGERP